MNQKDYEAIAEIIKKLCFEEQSCFEIPVNRLCHRLADLYEKEDNKRVVKITHKQPEAYKEFNREQFLIECGVE